MATGLLPLAVPETAVVTKLTIDICSKQRTVSSQQEPACSSEDT